MVRIADEGKAEKMKNRSKLEKRKYLWKVCKNNLTNGNVNKHCGRVQKKFKKRFTSREYERILFFVFFPEIKMARFPRHFSEVGQTESRKMSGTFPCGFNLISQLFQKINLGTRIPLLLNAPLLPPPRQRISLTRSEKRKMCRMCETIYHAQIDIYAPSRLSLSLDLHTLLNSRSLLLGEMRVPFVKIRKKDFGEK